MRRLALGIPHTPWVPERVAHMEQLRTALRLAGAAGGVPGAAGTAYREFTERAPNHVWSGEMWSWLAGTRAEWCVTLQDDVEVAPCFWRALDAQLDVLDGAGADVCGLASVHPIQVEMARQGQRWYRTRSWLVGWAYAIRRDALVAFLEWRDAVQPEHVTRTSEDSLLNEWVSFSGRSAWHSIPAIVDHVTTLESTYANDLHVHRRPWITWRDVGEGSLTSPEFWRPGGPPDTVPLLPTPTPRMCWACGARPGDVGTANGVMVCRMCVAQMAGALISR